MSFEWVVEGLLLSIVAVVSKNQFSGFSSFSIFIQVFQFLLICFQFLSNVFHFYSIFYFLCWEHFLAAFLILHFIFLLYNFINFMIVFLFLFRSYWQSTCCISACILIYHVQCWIFTTKEPIQSLGRNWLFDFPPVLTKYVLQYLTYIFLTYFHCGIYFI